MNKVACTGGDSDGDEEAAALEREVEAIRAQDDAAITDRVDRAARDRAKGAAVKNQKALWDRMLEMRILLQRCLQVSALLERGPGSCKCTETPCTMGVSYIPACKQPAQKAFQNISPHAGALR